MSDVLVLDASAVVAFLRDEAGSDRLATALEKARNDGENHLICAVNWAEVIYIAAVHEPERVSTPTLIGLLDSLPVTVVHANRDLAVGAAYLKHRHGLALADAFAAALALEAGVPLMTADADFDTLVEAGLVVERVR
jgi:predicted nucleic acid-binding protein